MKNDASCFSCALTGAESKWGASPNAARPCGRLHWATIVAHFVRRPLCGPSSIFPVVINIFRTFTKNNIAWGFSSVREHLTGFFVK